MYCIAEGSPEQLDYVAKGLIDFNQKQLGTSLVTPEKVTRIASDENGKVLGGIVCTHTPILDNLSVDILWVADEYRGTGLGSVLLHSVEDYARQQSCILAHLETMDFQAKDFYTKQGYSIFGTLEGPPNHTRYFMKKEL
ncbi:GNAT family N-acetyltransferase [Ruminococcaceae bacterium OttesenSCG-928-D13]|nr:GNAT family N-acetyltransferase [Ruminococcaceae bacterium OttesenSCG-928-D13]